MYGPQMSRPKLYQRSEPKNSDLAIPNVLDRVVALTDVNVVFDRLERPDGRDRVEGKRRKSPASLAAF